MRALRSHVARGIMVDIQRQLSGLLGRDVQRIRKTSDNPARISVIDVVAAITGHRSNGSSNAAVIFMRLKNDHPEVTTNCNDLKFPGKGQRKTPVASVRGIVEIIMLLPGRTLIHMNRS